MILKNFVFPIHLNIAGSDPGKCLLLWWNRFNFGCFLLLGPGFGGQKVLSFKFSGGLIIYLKEESYIAWLHE